MLKKLSALFFAVLLIGITFAQADAARLYGRCQYGGSYYQLPTWYYSIAYEAYSNVTGVSTTLAELEIDIDYGLNAQIGNLPADSVNIILTNARFNQPAGWTFVLFNTDSNLDSGDVVGVLAPGSTLDNLGFTIICPGGNCTGVSNPVVPASVNLYLGMAQCSNPTDPGTCTQFQLGAAIYVNPGLDASCTNFPEVKIAFTAPNETAGPMTFAKIYPAHYLSIGIEKFNLNAELNTDKDFKEFLGGPQVVDVYNIDTCGTSCSGGSCDQCLTCGKPMQEGTRVCTNWIAGYSIASATPTFTASFDLVSASPEPGVKEVRFENKKCTEAVSDKKWSCSETVLGCAELDIEVDGTTELNPTVWTLENIKVSNIKFGSIAPTNYCLSTSTGTVGAWWGGVEAIVPFVRTSTSAETYIKLFNRYSKDAKLYAEVFNNDSGKVIVALKQLSGKEVIPAGGAIEITGSELKALCPSCDWNFGQAIKFLVRVPSQTGCMSASGTSDGTISGTLSGSITTNENNGQSISGAIAGTLTGTYAGVNCYNNPYDPYIEGIVVSVAGGQQRSIPLLFKAFKQGQYNQ